MLVARSKAERLLIDQLPEAIEEGCVLGRDRDLRQIIFEPERGKFLCGMRKQIDAHANGPDFGRRLEYPAGNFRSLQREPKRQSADAGSDDNDVVHVSFRHLLIAAMKHDW